MVVRDVAVAMTTMTMAMKITTIMSLSEKGTAMGARSYAEQG